MWKNTVQNMLLKQRNEWGIKNNNKLPNIFINTINKVVNNAT